MEERQSKKIYPGIDDEVAVIQAQGTISNIFDALVELITNSDDSYKILEADGKKPSGNIDITIKKSNQGFCESIRIRDEATGIPASKIEEIFCYGKPTSGLYLGKSVRGFFGRGLKESILSLGQAEITTSFQGQATRCKYYYSQDEKKLILEIFDQQQRNDPVSYTDINIICSAEKKIRCPDFEKIYKVLNDHFVLRDINRNLKRNIKITLEKGNKKYGPKRLFFKIPSYQQIENLEIISSEYGPARFVLYESPEKLYYSKYDPSSLAGILVKTKGAILENYMFGFENDQNSHYFFGELDCPGIFEKLLKGDKSLIRPDRKGLYWQKLIDIEEKVKNILARHIERKKAKSYESSEEMPQERLDKFRKVLKKLNILAEELTEIIDIDEGIKHGIQELKRLTIYPSEGSAPPYQNRVFSIYYPKKENISAISVFVELEDSSGNFELSDRQIILTPIEKYANLLFGYFKIKGFKIGDTTNIIVRCEDEEDIAEFKVKEEEGKKEHGKRAPKEKTAGIFKKIVFDDQEKDPNQRVYYDRSLGYVIIYLNFPGIKPHLEKHGNGIESEKGSMLFSELLAEAFCREISRRKADKEIFDAEGRLDYYLKMYNEYMKKCLPVIQKIFLISWG